MTTVTMEEAVARVKDLGWVYEPCESPIGDGYSYSAGEGVIAFVNEKVVQVGENLGNLFHPRFEKAVTGNPYDALVRAARCADKLASVYQEINTTLATV